MFNVIGIVKGVTSMAAGLGAAKITKCAIEKVVPVAVNKMDKVLIAAGSISIGAMVSGAASNYVEEFIDETTNAIKSIIKNIKKEKENIDAEKAQA